MQFQLRKIGHVVLNVTDLERAVAFYTGVLGVPIHFEGRRRADCQIAIEFTDPDGNNLEIYWNIDQVGTEGVVRPASEWRPAKSLEEAVANPVKGQTLPWRG